jgi:hypothetical protein
MLRCSYRPVNRYRRNHTVARQLLRDPPGALSGENTMEGFNAEPRNQGLDEARNRVAQALLDGNEDSQEGDRRRDSVSATGGSPRSRRHVIATAGIRREARRFDFPKRSGAPGNASTLFYINVLLKHWRPIADISAEMYWPPLK